MQTCSQPGLPPQHNSQPMPLQTHNLAATANTQRKDLLLGLQPPAAADAAGGLIRSSRLRAAAESLH